MSKKKLPKLYKRKWLNKDKGSAYIILDAEVDAIDWGKHKGSLGANINVEIKDCYRQLSLEFYYNDEKEYQQRLTKMRGLIEALEEMERFMKDNPFQKPDPTEVKEEETKKAESKFPYLESLPSAAK